MKKVITVAAVWSGSEQDNFLHVLDSFTDRSGIRVTYEHLPPTNLSDALDATIADGPPAVVMLPQPALLPRLVACRVLQPLPKQVQDMVTANYDEHWRQLGTVGNTPYGVVFKVTNKSLMWYDSRVLQQQRVATPDTWQQFLALTRHLADDGYTPVSIGGGDGWVLTDWFENVYLQTAGPDAYDTLALHKIPWTHPTVVKALTALAELWSQKDLLLPNPAGTSFDRSVENVFALGQGVFVFEGDFVADRITANGWADINETAQFFDFPSLGTQRTAVVAGDTAVMLDASPETQALMRYLASPEAAQIWARAGSFISPVKTVDINTYPAGVTRKSSRALRAAQVVRFDLSDQQPPAFGSTPGAGLYESLQEFLRNPKDPARIAQQLEVKATRILESANQQRCPR